MKKCLLTGLAAGLMIGTVGMAHAASINVIANGNFENGLNGWTISNPDHHPLGIVNIDIDGAGSLPSSNAFYTMTAGGFGSHDVNISQTLSLLVGTTYTLSVNLASYGVGFYTNASGGQVTATLNGSLLDMFDFGSIGGGSWEYGTLSGSLVAASSSALLNIEIYRPFMENGQTPLQYLDNVSLTYENDSNAVPEPATILLFGVGLAGLASARRKMKA